MKNATWWLGLLVLGAHLPMAAAEPSPGAPNITCEIRFHYRERLEGIAAGGKQFSAPATKKESLPASHVTSDHGQKARIVEGKVAHLPYRFTIQWNETAKGKIATLEVNVTDAAGEPLAGFPQSSRNPFANAEAGTTKAFEIPLTKTISRQIEEHLLAKNEHLTHVDLVIVSGE